MASDGSIIEQKRKDGRSFNPKHWRVCVSLGKDPISKRRIKKQRVVIGSKADAKKVRDQIIQDYKNGLKFDADTVTFREYADHWHELRKEQKVVGDQRLSVERQKIDLANRYIGDVPLVKITPEVIESLYLQIYKDKVEEYGSYSSTSMNMLHAIVKAILKKATDNDYILRNPCDRVTAPKVAEPDRKSLTDDQVGELLAVLDKAEKAVTDEMEAKEARRKVWSRKEPRKSIKGISDASGIMGTRIALATGMRRGEVFGLTWGCVNIITGAVKVRQSLTTDKTLKKPKSKAGIRTIYLDRKTVLHLRKWKTTQADYLAIIGVEQTDETPVCCDNLGGFMDLHHFERWWIGFRKSHGFDDLKFHELRHTQATQLLAHGVDVKTVQARMGHANAALTLNWYAHAIPDNDKHAAVIIGDLFGEGGENSSEEVTEKGAKTA